MPEGGRTIQVVDDDDDIREILVEVLENFDHHVVTAHNGRDALAVLRSFQVDVIVLDLTMPHMDGHGFLSARETLNRAKNIPVLVVTASRDPAIGEDERVQAVIRKPFSSAELVAAIVDTLH